MTDGDWLGKFLARVKVPQNEGDWKAVESLFSELRPIARRKRLGQFFTPPKAASLMADWVLGCNPQNVLDPSVGLGIFPWVILRRSPELQIAAVDIDPSLAAAAEKLIPGLTVDIRDFLGFSDEKRYDAIICNPPYVRHHIAKLPDELFQRYSDAIGERLSRLTNIYALFLIEITIRLAGGGRAAVITPSEYLNADFGAAIKRYLVEKGYLWGLIIFDHAAEIFGDALTTASIALIQAPEQKSPQPVRIFRVSDVKELATLQTQIAETNPASHSIKNTVVMDHSALDPNAKWQSIGLKTRSSEGFPLGNYVKCCRGIATGANNFFTLSLQEANELGIPRECLIPCITKSSFVPGKTFDEHDLARLIESGKKAFLVDTSSQHPAVKNYLAMGETEGVHRRYLPSHRNPWYALENREPAPIWVNVFGRGGFRFVRNYTNALTLTTFHNIYPDNLPEEISIDDLAEHLSSPACQDSIREQMRVYGGGLEKLEPRDVLRIQVFFDDSC